jgi:hypothetical protein
VTGEDCVLAIEEQTLDPIGINLDPAVIRRVNPSAAAEAKTEPQATEKQVWPELRLQLKSEKQGKLTEAGGQETL